MVTGGRFRHVVRGVSARLRATLAGPQTPLRLLGVVSALSLGTRLLHLDRPVRTETRNGALIFDEQYYVNAARVILGIHPGSGDDYVGAALFHDPNAEHPGLAKLIIVETMRTFGDNPVGWRVGPVVFGSLALIVMYWLVRTAGGSSWLALGAASLMAADNLMMVHGRIATLDIFLITFMLAAVALYLRGRTLLAGLALGFGLAAKLLAVDAVFVVGLLELGLVARRPPGEVRRRLALLRSRVVPLLTMTGVALVTYLAVLFLLDLIISPIGGPGTCPTTATGFHNPIRHTTFMLCYAGKLTSPNGPEGIASYPWQWLMNQRPIDYFTLTTTVFSGGKEVASHVIIAFRGEMNPAIILFFLPALGLALHTWWRDRDRCALLAVAWFLGTFVPFLVAAAPLGAYGRRTSYLYYMVVVLPSVYLSVARLFSRRWLPPAALVGYVAVVLSFFVVQYPFRTWTGR